MKFKNFVAKNKKWLLPLVAALLILIIIMCGFAISEAVYRSEANVEAEVLEKDIYNWAPTDSFDINNAKYPTITPKSGDGNIKILQLTDIHFRNQGNFGSTIGTLYISDGMMQTQVRNLVKMSLPDLIVITGDLITYKGAGHAYRQFVEFIDSICEQFDCYWTLTFGNHDGEYSQNKVALAYIMQQSKYCLFDLGPTNFLFDGAKSGNEELSNWQGYSGIGNFIIKVCDKNGNLTQALILMDSNDWVADNNYPQRKYATLKAGYYPMQIEWYNWVCEGLKNANGGKELLTSLFAHISPYRAAENTQVQEEKALNSDCITSWVYDGITYDMPSSIIDNNSTKFVFVGHTHYSGFTYKTAGNIYYTNGNKTGYNYNDSTQKTGGTFIQLNANTPTIITHYHNNTAYDTVTCD